MVEHDAISFSLRSKLDLLRSGQTTRPFEARAFVQLTDADDDGVRVVYDSWQLAKDEWFRDADLYVYEFGIQFDLFNAVFLTPPERPILGVFHNITPPELVNDEAARAKSHASMVQAHNLARCAEVLCISPYNVRSLHELGIDDVPTSVLGLPPARPPAARPSATTGSVEMMFIGRFVPSKGILDLLEAVDRAVAAGATDLHLVAAGSPTFSDRSLLDHLRGEIHRRGLDDHFEILLAPDDEALATRLSAADALVVPSYHEGYCVPVMEALASGCHVISYDAASLPDTLAGLGALVRTGDVQALGDAIVGYCTRRRGVERESMAVPTASGDVPQSEWLRRVAEVLAERSEQRCNERFLDAIERSVTVGADRG